MPAKIAKKYHYGYRSPMKFVQCLHNSTDAFCVWFKVVGNDFSEELTYKKKQYPRDMPNCILFLAVSLKHNNLYSRWFCYLQKTQFNKIFNVAVEVKNDSVKERRSIVFAAVDEIPKKKNFAEYCSWASVNYHWAPCVSDNICLNIINYDLNCQRSFK